MDVRSSKKQRGGKFSHYDYRAPSSHVIILLLQSLLSATLVESAYMLSKDCTKISLKGRRITVIEGKPFNFFLQPYIVDCDNPGCKTYYDRELVCDTSPNCKSCSMYKGPFSPDRIQVGIWLLSDIHVRAPGSSCSIGSTPTALVRGSYPVSCVIKNRYASNVYQYLLRVIVIDSTKPNDLGSPADLLAMIGFGATIMVAAGEVDPDASSIFWADTSNIYYPGDRIRISVSPRDQFGNVVSEKTGRTDLSYPWNVTVVNLQTNATTYPNFDIFIDRNGYHNLTFVADQLGPQKVYISSNGKIFGRSSLTFTVITGSLYLPLCQGNWVDDKHTFISGTIAKFRLKVVDKFNTPLGTSNSLLYSIRIYDEAGNMDLHPQLNAQNEAEPGFVLIEFRTAKAGRHYVFIGNNTFYVPGSPFAYDVFVGQVSIPHCVGRLTPDILKAGSVVILNITLLDPSQNLVKRLSYVEFSVTIRLFDREFTSPTIVKGGETSTGYQAISFYPTLSGKYSMSVGYRREYISNSPFYFTVLPGPFSVARSTAIDHTDFMNAIAGSPILLTVQQKDVYGNTFSSETKYNFRVTAFQITKGGRSFVVPRVSASYDAKLGLQFLNIILSRAGNSYLEIGSTAENISGSPFPIRIKAGALTISACIGYWVSKTVKAGSLAQFTVIYMDSFGNNVSMATGSEETISMMANISLSKDFIIGLSNIDMKIITMSALGVVNIYLNITTAGEYYLHILASSSGKMMALGNSPFFFKVNPDLIMPGVCDFSWPSNSSYVAGDQVVAKLFLKDRFNNSVIVTQNELMMLHVTIYRTLTSETMNLIDANILTGIEENAVRLSFLTKQSGNFQLSITDIYGSSISASPYLFSVVPGPVVIKNCSGQWQNNTQTVEEGSLAEFIIKERDAFGNVVCRNISRGEKQLVFQARILGIEKAYVSGLEFKALVGKSDDILCGQLLTFPVLLYNLGQYRLEIKSGNQSIYGSPYPFNVVEGPVSSSLSTFEGPGLDVSSSGKPTYYVMTLRDDKGAPKGSHLGSLNVEILEFNKMIQIKPNITAVPNSRGVFNVTYLPTIAGAYVIMTRWLGVQVGEARYMTVNPGAASAVNCTGMWENNIVNVEAGQIARFIITQRDMYGNGVFSINSSDAVPFMAQVFRASDRQPIFTSVMSLQLLGDSPTKNQVLTFQIWEEGSHLLQIESEGENIYGSPFPFTCTHGPVALPECSGEWQDGIHSFLVGETAKFLIYCTQDVSATNYNFNPLKFQALVMDNSVVPTPDMSIEKMVTENMGSQLLRFSPKKSGTFLLSVQNVVKKRLTGSPFKFTVKQGAISMKHCRGKWMTGINTFEVGTDISLVIRQSDIYGNAVYDPYPFTVKVVESDSKLPVTMSGEFLRPLFKNKTEYMLVNVTLKVTGNFSLYIGNASLDIAGSPYLFSCIPGFPAADNTEIVGEGLSPLASINFWNEVIVYIRDVYNNIIPVSNISLSLDVTEGVNIGMEAYNIIPITNTLISSNVTESTVRIDDFKPHFGGGYRAAYRPDIAGLYYISISFNGSTLETSPSNIAVGEGWIQARFCTATFKPSNIVIAGEITYVYVMARDPQGNSVSYTTQAVNFSVTPLPVGIALPKSVNTELYNASQGLYVANFSIKTTGTYMVEITAYGSHINGSFYVIEVVPGPISPQHCIINTSDLSNVKLGGAISIEVEARDKLGNTVNGTDLGIQDAHFMVDVIGSQIEVFNLSYIGNGIYGVNLSQNTLGSYNLSIKYGGQSITTESMVINVLPNDVDPLKCTYTISTSDRVLIGTSGVFTIQAKDSFGNNRTSGGEGFAVDLINTKASVIYSGVPFDGDNGIYLFPFRLETDGTYNINITYKGINIFGQNQFVVLKGSTEAVSISHVIPTLLPAKEHTTITLYGENLMQIISFSCNFGDIETRLGSFNTTQETLKCETPYIDVATDIRLAVQLILYQGKSTFNFDLSFYVSNKPIAMKDEVWSWINKFVSFNPLLNDYVSYGSPKLGGVCKGPFYGKAEVVGSSLVYTPQVNFTGIDKLIYTIMDFKSQIAYGDVSITVFAYVPQFVSNPRVLIGLEDQPIPSQRGIKGLEIMSPNIDETLEMEVQAKHGHIYFAPDLPQLWQGVQVLSFDNQEESMSNSSKSSLVFTGSFTLVSAAVQALRYLGEPLFNGNDYISMQMFNKKQEGSKTSILVLVQAKNNPPFINISSNILFFNATYWKTHNEIPITSIAVGDPDERDVRGTTKELQLKISIEVSSQSLKIPLGPTSLSEISNAWINPSEAKLRENKRIITGHKIEFQDTVQSCNDALKSLHVIITNPKGLRTVLLTIIVNDLGNFGCTEDCSSNSTSPLQDVERILINFEYIPPDVRAKIASGLTCPLVFMLYVTILIIRYRRSLSYDYDDGTLSEEDMLKKTRVFNPMWSKDDVKEDFDDALTPQNADFHMENIFEAPVVLQEDSLFDEAVTLDRHNSGEYQYSNENKGSIVGHTARKNIFLIDDS